MKKIGLLYGKENSFPPALIERINARKEKDIVAEAVTIDQVIQGEAGNYAVIIDRISQDVPFYRSYLKNAALAGTAVINNPFWWSADEKFFNNCLATRIGVPVPRTVLLPSRELPPDTSDQSFRNLAYPMNWESIFSYVGFPAYMKPFSGGGWKNVYKLENAEEFFQKHAETGQLVMMLQEEIVFESYYRCYCIGGEHVRIMPYEPRHPFHLRYQTTHEDPPQLLKTIEDYTLRLNQFLGYDFNTVEFAVKEGVPYAIDFCNPAPDADEHSVGRDNFEWVLEATTDYAIQRARQQEDGKDNLTWGLYLQRSVEKKSLTAGNPKRKAAPPEKKKAAGSKPKKAAAKPARSGKPEKEK